jgi:hypothetical protein
MGVSRVHLPQGAERGGGGNLDSQDPGLRRLVLAPTPCEEGLPALGSVPQVLFLPLLQFLLFTALMILCRVLGTAVVTCGALISPWMPQGAQ